MAQEVALADNESLRERLYSFRYQTYVGRMGLSPRCADHERRRLSDGLDDVSTSFALLDCEQVIGSLRLTLMGDLPDPSLFVNRFRMETAAERFGLDALCMCSRFLFDDMQSLRMGMYRVMKTAFEYAWDRGMRVNYTDSSAELKAFYEKMGYRSYGVTFQDPDFGPKHAFMVIAGGPSWFTRGHLLGRIAAAYPKDAEAVQWFCDAYQLDRKDPA